jgi:hypothetical protein
VKSKIPAVLILFVLSVAIVLAGTSASTKSTSTTGETERPEVFGRGTTNYIPIWTGGSTIGNSPIFQSGGEVGIGTTAPQATLDVESAGLFGIEGTTSSAGDFATGVFGRSSSTSGLGIRGEATSTTGINNGVYGQSDSTSGIGVRGSAIATTGNAYGVLGNTATTGFGAGVLGDALATTGTAFGVFGRTASTNGNAIFADASATSGSPVAVVGFVESPNGIAGRFHSHSGSGLILQGLSGSNFAQVFTIDASGNGFLAGNLVVTGTVSKGGGSFKIDHPLDPSNKTLSHSFVESPDMMNIYNGVASLDTKGQASVSLPDWFESLNGDCRYLLTAIGAPQPELYIAEEIRGNRFRIAGGKPGAKVSWQVTGIRRDAFANAHRIRVEEDKPVAERGSYMHPETVRPQDTKNVRNGQKQR